jgi:hypothetical protein
MPRPTLNLLIDAGALLTFSPGLNPAIQEDHQVLQLYAQLAADKQSSRDTDPLAWLNLYIAALKRFGMNLPCTEHRWFDADAIESRTLLQWLTPPPVPGEDDSAWAAMSSAMQQMASGAGDDQARQLLHTQAVHHTVECSSLSLLLVHVAADATVDLWFARLRTRELIERNLFAHVFAGSALLERVELFHHAGTLGEGYAVHRATLADQVATRRQDALLPIVGAGRRQP